VCHATRRDINLASLSLTNLLLQSQPCIASEQSPIIGISASTSFDFPPGALKVCSTIHEAIEAASDGSRLLIAAGKYQESVSITGKTLLLEAWPEGAKVQVEVNTTEPYVHCLQLIDSDSSVKGLSFVHFSKSVADNYGVLIRGGSPQLIDCTVSSRSGSGIGIEGSREALIKNCQIQGCKAHGIAAFSPIEAQDDPQAYTIRVERCDIRGSVGCGILVKEQVALILRDNKVEKNGLGLSLDSLSQSSLQGNIIAGNRDAAIRVSFGSKSDFDPILKVNDVTGKTEIKA